MSGGSFAHRHTGYAHKCACLVAQDDRRNNYHPEESAVCHPEESAVCHPEESAVCHPEEPAMCHPEEPAVCHPEEPKATKDLNMIKE